MASKTSTNTFGVAKFVVSADPTQGTHTTIAAALTAASSGDTIYIRDGTFTENITGKAGVSITASGGSQSNPNVTIVGKVTFTATGTFTISNIRLKTNSDNFLAVTGTNASVVNLNNCYLECSNNTGITFSSSSASAAINVNFCLCEIGTTGITLFAHSSAGNLILRRTSILNFGGSSTASTISAGKLTVAASSITVPLTTSSTGVIVGNFTNFNTLNENTTALTIGGGTSNIENCSVASGTASAISVSSSIAVSQCLISSSNTNAITGAGTINYNNLAFNSTSKTINVTTQTTAGTIFGSTTKAPTAGFIGEQIRSAVASGSAVNLAATTVTNITSISLTPGVWDVSGIVTATFTGTSGFFIASVNSVSATLGTDGDNRIGITQVATSPTWTLTIPAYRVTVTTTTTYYLIGDANFTTGTCSGFGRISATRVG